MLFDVEKNENEELPVPLAWRSTIYMIVDALKAGNSQAKEILNVEPVDSENAELIDNSIQYYGDTLISLPDETWETSIYRWMVDRWDVMVDLFTSKEGRSDLVLFLSVFEKEKSYRFQVQSVHVP